MHTPSSRSFSREVNTKQPTLNIWKWNRTSFLDFPFSTFLLSFFIFTFPPHRLSTLICSSSHSWLWLVYPKHITLKVWIGWKSSSSQFYDDGILEENVYSSSSRIKDSDCDGNFCIWLCYYFRTPFAGAVSTTYTIIVAFSK